MPRKRLFTDDDLDRIAERRKRGTTFKQLAKEFGCSQGTITNALRRHRQKMGEPSRARTVRGPRRGRTVASSPSSEAPPPSSSQESIGTESQELGDDEDTLAGLRRQVAQIDRLIEAARIRGDEGAVATHMRNRNATVTLIAKLSPPPPPNHDDSPDMIAAANRVRRKLHELLGRAIAERREEAGR